VIEPPCGNKPLAPVSNCAKTRIVVRMQMADDPATGGPHGVATNLGRVRSAIRSLTPLMLAIVTAGGTPDLSTAQTISFSQPVTVLRGQPATPANQADQPPPPVAANPYWYTYPYSYPYWGYASYRWGWGWGAPWLWGWPAGISVGFGNCLDCRFHPAFFQRRFFHPGFFHRAFFGRGFARPGFGHPGFSEIGHAGFQMRLRAGIGGGFRGGRR
jgi:hypothetical protein